MSDFTTVNETLRAYVQTLAANMERAYRRDIPQDERFAETVSPAEMKLAEAFNRVGLDGEYIQQHPVGRYDADFYFPRVSLCIEVDGWHHKERGMRDRLRDEALAAKGIFTYRVPARFVLADANACAWAVHDLIDRLEIEALDEAR